MVTGFGPDEGGLPSIGELTGTDPAREPGEVTAAMTSEMGYGPAPRRRGEPLPDVSGLADELGLT